MNVLYFVLALLALVCFVAAALGVKSPRVELVALGLAFWVGIVFTQLLQRL